jgi:hypothetical protein
MIGPCVLGAHTSRFACQDALGLPAGALNHRVGRPLR